MDHSDRDARLFLLRATQHPAPHTHAYAVEHGVIRAANDIRNGSVPATVRAEIRWPAASITDDIEHLNLGELSLLTPEHEHWPATRLDDLDPVDRPFGLWIRGSASLAELTAYAATITGSRVASHYGTTVTAQLADAVAAAGVSVVNGGGYGVDEAALRATVCARGRAVVVLPCGIDQSYPRGNASLFDEVLRRGGLLVSEYPPGSAPSRARFAGRIRLLAALSAVTTVVEAGRRSGAAAVAHAAHDLGGVVLGVPGSIYSATSCGVHELIQSGTALLTTSADDMLQACRPIR